jgi:Tol biopolymer transport system component
MRVVELDTGHNDSLFPGLAITGEPGRAYDISPDGRKAVGGAQDREGKQRLWIAALDRQSPPRQIPGVEGQTPVFGKNGEVFFRSNETGPKHVYGVREDGTGLRKLSGMESGSIQGISPDRQWVLAGVRQDGQYTIMAFPVSGGSPVPVVSAAPSTVQHLGWSPDGKLIFFSETSQPTATHIVGRTYVVPLPKGQTFPTTPFTSQADLARQPGVRVIDAYDTAPGPTSDVYAFSRATVQRNLYRIPIP